MYNAQTTYNLIKAAPEANTIWIHLDLRRSQSAMAFFKGLFAQSDWADKPVSLLTILNKFGFKDACFVLSYAMLEDRLARHFQAWLADQVLYIYERECPEDKRVRNQIESLSNDHATPNERELAKKNAKKAAHKPQWEASREVAQSLGKSLLEDFTLPDGYNGHKEAARAAARAASADTVKEASWAALRAVSWNAALKANSETSKRIASRFAWHSALKNQEKQLRSMITEP